MKNAPTFNVGSFLSVPFSETCLVVTCLDLHNEEATVKIFDSYKEADFWSHEVSLKQCPEWHEHNCYRYACDKREGKNE